MERKIPILMLVLAILGFTYMLAPIVVVVMAGLTAGEFLTFPPQGFSLRWVAAFLQSESYLSAFFFSFRLALMTMVVSTILGTAAALFLSHTNIVGRGAMRAFFLSPVVLPGVVVGFALFSFYISKGLAFLGRSGDCGSAISCTPPRTLSAPSVLRWRLMTNHLMRLRGRSDPRPGARFAR